MVKKPVNKYEVLENSQGEWWARIKSSNGRILFWSETYKSKASAKKVITSLIKGMVHMSAAGPEIVEIKFDITKQRN